MINVPSQPLPRSFYDRPTRIVARQLLGKVLIRQDGSDAGIESFSGGVIVETEAYLSANDPACHANRGIRPRNRTMFGPSGHLYVYSIHAKYCMNVVTEAEGLGSAALIRAIEPLWGGLAMAERRGSRTPRDWTRGPARLCQAIDVDRKLDGYDLTLGQRIWIAELPLMGKLKILSGPRIGISQAQELPLRFFVDGNPFVSGKAGDHSSRPTAKGLLFPGNRLLK